MQDELFQRPEREVIAAAHACSGGTSSYVELLESAESVLRGDAPSGALMCIVDARVRRKLASDLMQRDTCTGISHDWIARFRDASARPDECVRQFDFIPKSGVVDEELTVRCRCGLLPKEHAEKFATMFKKYMPLCWHDYTESRMLTIEQRNKRVRAAVPFNAAMSAAVVAAHSAGPVVRVRAAWEVLDAVERGGKISGPLARFLRIGRKAVKTWIVLDFPLDWMSYGQARRVLRTRHAVPAAFPWDASRNKLIWLPIVDLVARAAGIEPVWLFRAMQDSFHDLDRLPDLLNAWQKRQQLRSAIRLLRRNSKGGPSMLRSELLSILGRYPDPEPEWSSRIELDLPCGWHARTLLTRAEICLQFEETEQHIEQMVPQVLKGEAQIFALHSASGDNRVTVAFWSPLLQGQENGFVLMKFWGDFVPYIPPAGLVALGELMQQLRVDEVWPF